MLRVRIALLLSLAAPLSTASLRAADLVVPSMRVSVIDEVDVPARRAGSLTELGVREGTTVREGTEIGRVDDAAATLAVRRAKQMLDLAKKHAESQAAIELARSALAEATAAVDVAELRVAIAERTAENTLAISAAEAALEKARADVAKWTVEIDIAAAKSKSTVDEDIARATTATAQTELDRAVRAGGAVAASEIASLRLARDKAKLEIERAVEDRSVAALTEKLKAATRESSRADVDAATVGIQQAKFDHVLARAGVDMEKLGVTTAKLAVESARAKVRKALEDAEAKGLEATVAETDHAIAEEELARHAVVSPVNGVVAERYHSKGEWVQPGENVVRILRLDRLRAEAYVSVAQIDAADVGRPAVVTVPTRGGTRTLPGELVHVSREVDTVNGQVLVWVEFDNPGFAVLPGVKGTMTIREE